LRLATPYETRNTLSFIPLSAAIGKRLGNHFDVIALIQANFFAASAFDFGGFNLGGFNLGGFNLGGFNLEVIMSLNAIFVAAQHFALTDFVVFPKLAFTSSTANEQHKLCTKRLTHY
jgi:hypothetical protein